MNNFRYPTNTLGPSRINLVSASAPPRNRSRIKVVLLIASAVVILMALSGVGILLVLPKGHVEYFNSTEGRVDWTTRPATDWPLVWTEAPTTSKPTTNPPWPRTTRTVTDWPLVWTEEPATSKPTTNPPWPRTTRPPTNRPTTQPTTNKPGTDLPGTTNKPEKQEMPEDLKTLYQEMYLNLDRTTDPCDDFYEYACGKFPGRHPVPENQREVSYFSLEYDKIRNRTIEILDNDSIEHDWKSLQYLKRVWDTCVQDRQDDSSGLNTLLEYFEQLDKLELWEEKFARVTKDGFNVFFTVKAVPHPRWSSSVSLLIDQPELEYGNAIVTESQFYPVLEYYSDLVRLSKNNVSEISAYMDLVLEMMDFEHWMATNATAESERLKRPWDFEKIATPRDLPELSGFNWTPILAILSKDIRPTSLTDEVLIRDPEYLRKFKAIIDSKDESFISGYIKMSLLRQSCFALGGECRQIQRNFLQQIDPSRLVDFERQTCFDVLSGRLEHLVHRAYTTNYKNDAHFTLIMMLSRIYDQMKDDVKNLLWMDENIQKRAIDKLYSVTSFSESLWPQWMEWGLDEKHQNITSLGLTESTGFFSYFWNFTRQMKNEEMEMLGSRSNSFALWPISLFAMAPKVNPLGPNMWIPNLVLQGHFFNEKSPIEINYGIFGSMLGHAMTHTIDRRAANFDEVLGKYYWTPETKEAFEQRMVCLAGAYDEEEVVINGRHYNMKINGSSTLDENLADWIGLVAAYNAYKKVALDFFSPVPKSEYPHELDKYSQDQMFFLSYAQTQCSSDSQQVLLDAFLGTHSPRKFRVNGPLKQMDEFAEAFDCDWGSNMNPRKKCVYH